MSEDAKEKVKYVLSLLKMVCMRNGLSVAADPDGHILFFSTDEYLKKGKNVAKCDGLVLDIQNLVR